MAFLWHERHWKNKTCLLPFSRLNLFPAPCALEEKLSRKEAIDFLPGEVASGIFPESLFYCSYLPGWEVITDSKIAIVWGWLSTQMFTYIEIDSWMHTQTHRHRCYIKLFWLMSINLLFFYSEVKNPETISYFSIVQKCLCLYRIKHRLHENASVLFLLLHN